MNLQLLDAGKNTQFKPRQSGNPAGRPRWTLIVEMLYLLERRPEALKSVRRALRAHFPEAKTDAHAFVMFMIIKAANKGDLAAFREIRRIVEGKTRYR